MKQIKLIFILLTVIFFTASCKKEHVTVPVTGAPVFYFNGTVNGISSSLEAGLNSYYMYSSYTQDSNHVYNFIGDLKQTNSSLSSIQIQINDYKISAINSNVQPDSSLHVGTYSYYSVGVTDTTYSVQFSSSYTNGTAQTYTWSFGDGSTAIGTTATQSHTYSNLGTYNVCLTISGSGGTNTICSKVNLSSLSNGGKKTTISTTSSGDTINFNATNTFSAKKFTWDFGDGSQQVDSTTTTYDSPSHNYSTPGIYTVSLTVLDSVGLGSVPDTIFASYNAATANFTGGGIANFTANSVSSVITTGSTLRLSNVTVNWTDANGIVYTSDNSAQPAANTFKILSEEAYQNNINGQLTRKLHVNFSCTLYNSGHPSIQITNADAVIAVAYK